MFIAFPVSRPFLPTLERDILLGEVDADKRDADWVSAAAFKMRHLFNEIADDAIDLLNHRLCEDFRLSTYLNCRDRASRHQQTLFDDSNHGWDEFAESPVSASRWLADPHILQVHNAIVPLHSLDQLL